MAKVKVTVKRTGGKKLQRLLREAGKGGVSGVKVGFFSTAKYEDGTPVAAVAAWNEFGTKTIPERPFFRRALAEVGRTGSPISSAACGHRHQEDGGGRQARRKSRRVRGRPGAGVDHGAEGPGTRRWAVARKRKFNFTAQEGSSGVASQRVPPHRHRLHARLSDLAGGAVSPTVLTRQLADGQPDVQRPPRP